MLNLDTPCFVVQTSSARVHEGWTLKGFLGLSENMFTFTGHGFKYWVHPYSENFAHQGVDTVNGLTVWIPFVRNQIRDFASHAEAKQVEQAEAAESILKNRKNLFLRVFLSRPEAEAALVKINGRRTWH